MDLQIHVQGEGICRNLFHVDIHDPKTAKIYCNYCESYVKENSSKPKLCICCGNKIIKKKEYKLLRIMLNNAIEQYETQIKCFIKTPSQGKIVVFQKWKWITYGIPLDCLSLYYDTREPALAKERKGGLPTWAKEFYKKEQFDRIREKGVLAFIDSHTKAEGIG